MKLLSLLVVLTIFATMNCHKVLFIPLTIKSHIIMHAGIAKALVKQGHEAVILKHPSTKIPSQMKNWGIRFIGYDNGFETHLFDTPDFTNVLNDLGKTGLLSELPKLIEILQNECKDYLQNEALFNALAEEKFDFAVVDNLFALQCRFAVPYRLGIPYANLMVLPPLDLPTTTAQILYITPTMPAFYSETPTFKQRLLQFLLLNIIGTVSDYVQPMDEVYEYLKDKPISGIRELKENVALWFIDEDPVIGYARQLPPNVIYLGALSAEPAQKLEGDLQAFADSATEGLIVVSFGGSMYADFPQEQIDAILKALGMVKYKAVMRLTRKVEVGKNVKLVDWLPQNDIIGHRNTKVFITHGGKGSVNEATYHAVPMIGFPGQEEQWANCKRFMERGWGVSLDRNAFSAEELAKTIETVIKDPKYRNNILKASAIMHGRKSSPGEEASYWIDHVIKYGADHLKPYSTKLAWYQIMMLDVIGFLGFVAFIFTYLMVKCCGFCCRKCCGKTPEKQKKS